MKRFFLILVFFLSSCAMEQEEGLSGRYTGIQHFGIGQVDSPIVIVIRQTGNTLTGTVTPPFTSEMIPFENGLIQGATIRFDRKSSGITFRYEAAINPGQFTLQGGFEPLGCINPGSGEPCWSDSDGSFNATKN